MVKTFRLGGSDKLFFYFRNIESSSTCIIKKRCAFRIATLAARGNRNTPKVVFLACISNINFRGIKSKHFLLMNDRYIIFQFRIPVFQRTVFFSCEWGQSFIMSAFFSQIAHIMKECSVFWHIFYFYQFHSWVSHLGHLSCLHFTMTLHSE